MMMKVQFKMLILLNIILGRWSEYLEQCKIGFYLDTDTLQCLPCRANSSMITSNDGFSCTCDDQSVKVNVAQCKKCNNTEVLTADGSACVPRRCVKLNGRLTCRKCPADYIVATQNFDGSPLKEVQCIKCARGYRAMLGQCVKCEDCLCTKNELAIKGKCLPRAFITGRMKPETSVWHPKDVLDIVKYEYLCTSGDVRACRTLANKCVRSMYNTDRGGACRLWIQAPAVPIAGLPELAVNIAAINDLQPGEIRLLPKMKTIKFVLVQHKENSGINIVQNERPCYLPQSFKIGIDVSQECSHNVTEILKKDGNNNFVPYLDFDGKLLPITVNIKKPGGTLIQSGVWKSSNFRRYFLADMSLYENFTSITYLKSLNLQLRLRREKPRSGLLIMHLKLEAEYNIVSSYTKSATISLTLKHDLPSVGVLRALEIWGGVLGAVAAFYAMIQWRGIDRRGGLPISLAPILAGYVADALYVSAVMACLHSLASESATTELALSLAATEEYTIEALLYSALGLKIIKIVWINWRQCRGDVFLLDWAEYNTSINAGKEECDWRTSSVAREWLALQTVRRVNPGYTVSIALAFLKLMKPWHSSLPDSRGYHCAVIALAWWSAYILVTVCQWVERRFFGDPPSVITRVCQTTGVSLLVFQEEYFAHYVNGRNDNATDLRALTGPLTSCRIICAQQLRTVYKQLCTPSLGGELDKNHRKSLLTKFLAAFFERALDGLSWVASERTVLERLLDVELNVRESNTTSVLLYDHQTTTPTCMNVTWWGEEFSFSIFDATVFIGIYLGSLDVYIAAFGVLIIWQVLKYVRETCGRRNFRTNTEIRDDWL